MAGKNNGLDAIMAMMALKTLMNDTKDLAIHPFTIEVTITPGYIGCSASGNRKFLEDLDGGIEWFAETASLITPIMREQTNKFFELAKKNFGLKEVGRSNTDEFDDFVRTVLSGGQNATRRVINSGQT